VPHGFDFLAGLLNFVMLLFRFFPLPLRWGVALCLPALVCHAATLELSTPGGRRHFYHDEKPSVTLTAGEPAASATLKVSLGGRLLLSRGLEEGVKIEEKLVLPLASLRRTRHLLEATLENRHGRVLARAQCPVSVTQRPRSDGIEVWLWALGTPSEEMVRFYGGQGFTSAGGPMLPYKGDLTEGLREAAAALDAQLPSGLKANVTPNEGVWVRPFALLPPSGEGIDYRNPGRYGMEEAKVPFQYYNPFSPAVAQAQEALNRQLMEALAPYPNLAIAFVDSERQDYLQKPNLNEEGRRLMQERLGSLEEQFGEPRYVAPHVIADDDPFYRLSRYIVQGGNGVNLGLRRMAETIRQYRPDLLTMTCPWRGLPLYDVYPDVDIIQTWTYTNPDPKLMLAIETLRTACAPRNQIPFQVVTLLNYPGKIAPTPDWMGMGPDRVKETTWINLSRAPRMVGYYYSSALRPDDPASAEGGKLPVETTEAIATMAREVIEPYGAMIRRLNMAPRKVAMLNSAASRVYDRHRLKGLYTAAQVVPFQMVMEMAHYQVDILFDESFEREGATILDRYEAVVLPRCDTMTQSVYEAVLAFGKNGKPVLVDGDLGPDLEAIAPLRFDFDFSFLAKVSADALARGETYADWDDHVTKSEKIDYAKVEGVPADHAQKQLEAYAGEVVSRLGARVRPPVSSNRRDVLFNLCEGNNVRYLFVINDRREYDDRVGQYRAIMEKLVPQEVEVDLEDEGDGVPVAYDMIRQKAVKVVRRADGRLRLKVPLGKLGGTIIAFYPRPIGEMAIRWADAGPAAPQRVALSLKDDQGHPLPGLQPLKVELYNPAGDLQPQSNFLCAEGGEAVFEWQPPWDEKPGRWRLVVHDLTSGGKVEKFLQVGGER